MPGGGFLIADTGNNRIRRVYPDGAIRTIAGSGPTGFAGDDGPATAAQLSAPQGVDWTPQGTVIFSDTGNNRVREVTADGNVSTVAGSDRTGTTGDGGAATAATLDHPVDVVATPHGFLVADSGNSRVRAVTFGAIVTIAGTGNPGFTGDVSLGPIAGLAFAAGLALQPDGGLLIADTDNQRIRRMGPRGTIMTAAGVGTAGVGADVADALQTELAYPRGVAAIADGGFLVADTRADRVRYVRPDGTTEVVVGRGVSKVLRVAAGRASEIRYPWNFWVEANRIEVRRGKRVTMCLTSNKRATIDVAVRKGSRKVAGARFKTGFLTRSCPSVSLGRLRATRYRVRVEATHESQRAKPDAFTLIVKR